MRSWLDSAKVYGDRRVLTILFLGFSSGLPLLLVFSTLSVWLKIEGVSLTAIGLFSLVRTPYTFKFLAQCRFMIYGLWALLGRCLRSLGGSRSSWTRCRWAIFL